MTPTAEPDPPCEHPHRCRRPGRRPGPLALALSVLLLATAANAQLRYSGELFVAPDLTVSSRGQQQAATPGTTFGLHLEGRYALGPVSFELMLDPSVRLPDPTPSFPPTTDPPDVELGVTEAYVLLRQGGLDLSAGIERLPLEVARLSRPFSLEPVGKRGLPQGLLGARAAYFVGNWRLRPAFLVKTPDLRDPDSFGQPLELGGVLSVRRDFTSFDLEAHGGYLTRPFAGLSASGSIGNLVVYGEGWLLLSPMSGRGAVGVSGFLGDGLWTLEAAFAPAPNQPQGEAFPQVGGQYALPFLDGSLDATAGVGLVDSVLSPGEKVIQVLASVMFSQSAGDSQFTIGPALLHSEFATTYALRLEWRSFFGN